MCSHEAHTFDPADGENSENLMPAESWESPSINTPGEPDMDDEDKWLPKEG
jgi:hypothetical protein